MVLIGGATRLTESGLSITQWKPVTGILPPLSAAEWQAEFDRYKQIPQFATLNPDMTLDGFKAIFWWEWAHRLLARIVGAAFILPGLWFWWKGQLKGALGRQVAVATGLLALEPIVGWWMVTSGLSQRTEVAQQRLALHLMIAAATFGALIYAAVGLRRPAEGEHGAARLRDFGVDLRGAHLLPARPRRSGRGVARRPHLQHLAADGIEPRFRARRSAQARSKRYSAMPATAQFDHRMIGYAVVAFAIIQAIAALRAAPGSPLMSRAIVLAAVALVQVALGVATLLARRSDRACAPPSGAGARPVRPGDRAFARDRDGARRLRRLASHRQARL